MVLKEKKTNQWTFNDDDEWYTFEKDVIAFLEHSKISKDLKIWCPFDDEKSAFVKVLKELEYNVVYSHIKNDQDFYEYQPDDYDLILSNPPFKGKKNIIERVIKLNKPFAFIFGIQCFNSGGFTAELEKLKDLKMVFVEQRMKFQKRKIDEIISSPTFHSMWICDRIDNLKTISFILNKKGK